MATKVADLYGALGMKVDVGAFNKANEAIGKVASALKAFIAIKVAGFVTDAVTSVIDMGGHLADASQKTGVAAETLQEYGYAAGLAGANLDSVVASLGKLNRGLAEAAKTGKGPAADGLKALGISLEDPAVKAGNLDALLLKVADKFKGMPDGPKKVAAAMDLFGKSGADLIPFLNQGGAGIAALKKEARELGVVIDNETIGSLDQLGDDVDRAKAGWQGFKNQMVAAIVPLLQELLPPLIELMKDIGKWAKEHKQEIAAVFFAVIETIKTLIKWFVKAVKSVAWFVGLFIQGLKDIRDRTASAMAWIGEHAVAAWKYISSTFQAMVDSLKAGGQAIVDAFKAVGQGIVDAFRAAFDWVIAKAKDVAKFIRNLPVIKQIADFGDAAVNKVAGSFTDKDRQGAQDQASVANETDQEYRTRQRQSRIDRMTMPGWSPAIAPTAPASTMSANTGAPITVTNTITVQPSAGMDELKLGTKVGEVVDARMSQVFRHVQNGGL